MDASNDKKTVLYDYAQAGFDGFLTRSIDSTKGGGGGGSIREINFDQTQITGSLGSTLQLGNIRLDGINQEIALMRDGVRNLMLGNDASNNPVLKIAREGADAKTAGDDELLFNSLQNNLKVVQTDSVGIVVTTNPLNWATVPHNLGFRPIPIGFLNDVSLSGIMQGGIIPLPTFFNAGASGGNVNFTSWIFLTCDETNLYIVTLNASGVAFNTRVKYYLLQESAS